MKAKVIVKLKPSVLDPQGKAVQGALHRLGYPQVQGVRVGKFIELQLDGENREKARVEVHEMCEKLLSNPVIEDAQYEFEG